MMVVVGGESFLARLFNELLHFEKWFKVKTEKTGESPHYQLKRERSFSFISMPRILPKQYY
jgi:hypothetical protein